MEPAAAWRSEYKDEVVTIVTIPQLKPKEHADTDSRPDNHAALSYDKECCKDLGEEVKGCSVRFKQVHVHDI